MLHDIAFAIKQGWQVYCVKNTQVIVDPTFFKQEYNILSLKAELYYYQIIFVMTKINLVHDFDLLELLFITENNNLVVTLNATNPFFNETAFFLQKKIHNNVDKIIYRGLSTDYKSILLESELSSIVQYFEQDCIITTRMSSKHIRITTKMLILSKDLLIQIIGKTVFITHKKNNEYFRTGPFIFTQTSEIIDKLLVVEELDSIDSSGIGGNIYTVAYIDIYEI